MYHNAKLVLPVCLFGIYVIWITGSAGTFLPDLTQSCFRCLCYAVTQCDLSNGCGGGYCGPFNISRAYWFDAGRVVMPEDEAERNHAWQDCARNYYCATRIIEKYMENYGRDCNGDGVTNCFDYMLVHGNGRYGCTEPLNRSANGRRWLRRYKDCRMTP